MNTTTKRDRALSRANALLAEECRRTGCPGAEKAFRLESIDAVGGFVVTIRRRPVACEGAAEIVENICLLSKGGMADAEGEAEMRRAAAVLSRAHLRTAALSDPTLQQDRPWMHDVHPLAADMLRHYGFHDDEICARADPEGRSQAMLITGGKSTDQHGTTLHVLRAEKSSGRLYFQLRMTNAEGASVLIRTGQDAALVIIGSNLPETMRSAMVGEKVGRLIGHPVFEASDVRIVGYAESDLSNDTNFDLDNGRVPLAPAPPGVDVSWMDLPA